MSRAEEKQCTECKRILLVKHFSKKSHNKSGLASNCKECQNRYNKKYRLAHKKKIIEKGKRHYVKNKPRLLEYAKNQYNGVRRNCDYMSKYNITLKDYDEMFDKQDGVCAICKLPEITRRLAVDHNHKTGKVRGLLCTGCNIALGHIKDNPERLENMKMYLEEHKEAGVKYVAR